jgi:F-type H+-transporting ATPase subunit c
MDNITLIAMVSIIAAAATIVIGCITPAVGETKAIVSALNSMAQQPDIASTITRTLFVGLAMIESMAIYCFVISMILIYANPFWDYIITNITGK